MAKVALSVNNVSRAGKFSLLPFFLFYFEHKIFTIRVILFFLLWLQVKKIKNKVKIRGI